MNTERPAQERRQFISGIPFIQIGIGDDSAQCAICGTIVDVGLEMREHVREHREHRITQREDL